jgi:hypothetical protein
MARAWAVFAVGVALWGVLAVAAAVGLGDEDGAWTDVGVGLDMDADEGVRDGQIQRQ